ncbi:MAG: sigma-54-dependent Fis family transcriptional regulator [Deltaproteobacteria bacterium]|nr:sigma-54-dependent Fis family transcriptional regulator [Deltaproteobacteria bacterium]
MNHVKQFTRASFHGIVGASVPMREVFELIKRAAKTNVSVLISGASGTGKELVARAIHDRSDRRNGPYLAFNIGAVTSNLISSTLFGHRKGSFTGALENQKGHFELAHEGTIFLDEISSIDEDMQIALLRVLETKTIRPIGAARSKKIDTRIIAASNKDLRKLVSANKFREDLLFRLEVFSIHLPQLLDRRQDIPLLVDHFLQKHCRQLGRKIPGITTEARNALYAYSWPGNVRELENTLHRAILLTDDGIRIGKKHLPSKIVTATGQREKLVIEPGMTLHAVQKRIIEMTLRSCRGNKLLAAKLLGISRKTLYNKIKQYRIGDD